ncbi:MAG: hypothetical protein ABL895_06315 [Cyclobacteriaceae bacterium]
MRYCFLILLLSIDCTSSTDTSDIFLKGEGQGSVGKKLAEASGLVASVVNPGYYWSHNDGENSAEVFLINDKAKIVMTCKLLNVANRDWEDITVGPGPQEGKSYLYVGEIGDNLSQYPYKMIYRFEEPLLTGGDQVIDTFDTLVFQLSDGVRDTEAMMIDPITNDVFIISKREDSVRLYKIYAPTKLRDTLQAEFKTKLPFSKIVAASISPDGTEVLMKNYDHLYYWKRSDKESIPELLQSKPIELNYLQEAQGEAIAWNLDATGFYTLSETVKNYKGNLIYYRRK